MEKNTNLPLNLFVVITFIIMVTVNALSALLPINGITPGEVSDSYPNLFAPAGITFSIWSLIYLLLAAYTLYQLCLFRGKEKKINESLLHKTGIVFSISSLVNAAWIFSWHYRIIPLCFAQYGVLLCLPLHRFLNHTEQQISGFQSKALFLQCQRRFLESA